MDLVCLGCGVMCIGCIVEVVGVWVCGIDGVWIMLVCCGWDYFDDGVI